MPAPIMARTTVSARADASSQFDGYLSVLMGTLSVWPSIWNFRSGMPASTVATSPMAAPPSAESSAEPDAKSTSVASATTIRPSTIFTESFPASINFLKRTSRLWYSAMRCSAAALRDSSSARAAFISSTEPLRRALSPTRAAFSSRSSRVRAFSEASSAERRASRAAFSASSAVRRAFSAAMASSRVTILASRSATWADNAVFVASSSAWRASYLPLPTRQPPRTSRESAVTWTPRGARHA